MILPARIRAGEADEGSRRDAQTAWNREMALRSMVKRLDTPIVSEPSWFAEVSKAASRVQA